MPVWRARVCGGRPLGGPLDVSSLFFGALVGCSGGGTAPSPFGLGGGGGIVVPQAGTAGAGGISSLPDPALGGPCAKAADCDDGIDCTDDACDPSLERCRYALHHELCEDTVFCNGRELCQPEVGCVVGPPVSCSDQSTCTIDECVEQTRSCDHRPRDADGDGDPTWNCGGGDCDDADPRILSSAAEICQNGVDDDCDQLRDEPECTAPLYDTCVDPLLVEQSGAYAFSFTAAREDYALDCVPVGELRRDVVVALIVADDGPNDVDLELGAASGQVALGAAERCDDPSTLFACDPGAVLGQGGSVSRLVLRDLPAGTYPLYLSSNADGEATLNVEYGDFPAPPDNETCGTAVEIAPGERVPVWLVDSQYDVTSDCAEFNRDLVYYFDLDEAQDVEVRSFALDDFGVPSLSLFGADCGTIENELACRIGAPASLFARALDPGRYHVVVGSSGPSELELVLELKPPSEPPAEEGCDDPPEAVPGRTHSVDLAQSVDAVNVQCLPGAADATQALSLEEASDVLLVERLSPGDVGAVSLADADCARAGLLSCAAADEGPVRAVASGVPPGEYRVITESLLGAAVTVTAYVRLATPPTLVAFADTCEDAIPIPEQGGRFLGNTMNAIAHYPASCDFGSGLPEGAADQMLRLELEEPRRVVFDLGGSAYDTLLVVRDATSCPGDEIDRACVPGYVSGRSYLETVLDAGDYFVQVDGYSRASGTWQLEVFLTDP